MDCKYKLTESNLHIRHDLDFIDKLLESFGAKAEPEARRYLLDLSYSKLFPNCTIKWSLL